MWTKLSDKQKKKYQKLAEADKVRYDREVEFLIKNGYFINQNGEKSTDLFKPSNVVMPNKVTSAYIFFNKSNMDKLRNEQPKLNITEMAKLSGAAW